MKRTIAIIAACLAGIMAISAASPQEAKTVVKDPKAALVARGRYLVGPAGQCGDCHTPTDQKGQPVRSQALQGAPILFKPTVPAPGWADMSLPIVGLPTMASDEEAVTFLMTGKHTDGKMAAPPMPQYRFNRRDAEAIVAYLRSLQQSAPTTPGSK